MPSTPTRSLALRPGADRGAQREPRRHGGCRRGGGRRTSCRGWAPIRRRSDRTPAAPAWSPRSGTGAGRSWRGTGTSTSCRPASPDTWTSDPWAATIDDGTLDRARLGRHERPDRGGARGGGRARAGRGRRSRHARVPSGRGRGAGGHPRDQGAVGARPARSGRVHRGRAQRAADRRWPSEAAPGSPRPRTGKAAHGSQPHSGVNAITSMARFVLRLPEVLPDLEHPLVGRPTVNAALIRGGSAPNVVPDRCEVDIDRRIVPGETDPDEVLRPVPGAGADILRASTRRSRSTSSSANGPTRPRRPPTSPIAGRRARGHRRRDRHARRPSRLHRHHGCPLLHQRRGDPHGDPGPGSLAVAHTANESIDVEELVAGARIYARIFATFLSA